MKHVCSKGKRNKKTRFERPILLVLSCTQNSCPNKVFKCYNSHFKEKPKIICGYEIKEIVLNAFVCFKDIFQKK